MTCELTDVKLSKKQLKRIKKYQVSWLQKINNLPKVVQCENCKRLGLSDPERFSIEYCHRVGIQFRCGSCLYPKYVHTLKNPTRGDVDIINRIKKLLREADGQ